jgi:predicted acetyltransferase
MDVRQLTERMAAWISSEYKAVIFSDVDPVGYALFKMEPNSIYLRQLFICRDKRRLGLGRQAFGILRSQIWPKDVRLTVEVLCSNVSATAFWRSVGFRDYFLALEIDPAASETSSN